ncbi:MAG: thiamine biosynthesis protein ThiF [Desulfobulbaceae bacterium]|nr:MAG: thiamine biosynthesis protein ThiF [Desulfobulbaceae bacterium]
MIFMRIKVHEEEQEVAPGTVMADIARRFSGCDLFIVDGCQVAGTYELQEGDSCWCLRKGGQVGRAELERLLYLRHTPGVQQVFGRAVVGIMGLGGLGSVVAGALVRVGIGRLVLADYDIVDPTNLNRQQFFVDQIGMKKTEALAANLHRMNPYVELTLHDCRLSAATIPRIFADVDVLVECFDDPVMKAIAFRLALTDMKSMGYVGASGVAGLADNNRITTLCHRPSVCIVGDNESEARPGQGLMAPRVGIAAHHQANQVLRILMQRAGRPV